MAYFLGHPVGYWPALRSATTALRYACCRRRGGFRRSWRCRCSRCRRLSCVCLQSSLSNEHPAMLYCRLLMIDVGFFSPKPLVHVPQMFADLCKFACMFTPHKNSSCTCSHGRHQDFEVGAARGKVEGIGGGGTKENECYRTYN